MPNTQRTNREGITPVLSYIILLGVTVILISLILTTFSAFEATQTEQTTENEITLILSNMTAELHYIDREASASNYQSFSQTARSTPRYIEQQGYSLSAEEIATNQYRITISSNNPSYELSQVVYLESTLEIEQGVVRSDIRYTYDPSTDTIIVE